ncbi:MAG: hypothetical protein ACRYGI_11585 [Janthinobacterium lividum]
MDIRIAEWLASGDTGVSSTAILLWLSARAKDRTWGAHTPSDPADLGRCLRLLERIPEWKSRMPEMAEAGDNWARIMPHWDRMAQSMCDEVGIDWSKARSAPLTYDLMKECGC